MGWVYDWHGGRFRSHRGAVNAALVDLGHRFRMLVNEVEVPDSPESLPRLPVGIALWRPLPDRATAAGAWILAGGPHHTCLSLAVNTTQLEDFAEIAGVELIVIDSNTKLRDVWNALRWNDASPYSAFGRA
jgi:L-arabinose isomerase